MILKIIHIHSTQEQGKSAAKRSIEVLRGVSDMGGTERTHSGCAIHVWWYILSQSVATPFKYLIYMYRCTYIYIYGK